VTIQLVLGDFCARNTTPNRTTTATIQGVKLKQTNYRKRLKLLKTIAAHDDSLFNERAGNLTCDHKLNSDTLHLISSGIQHRIA